MQRYAVLQILCRRVQGCHGDRYLYYLSYDFSKHPQVCSLDTRGSLWKKLLGYTKRLVSQERIVNLSRAQWAVLRVGLWETLHQEIRRHPNCATCHVLGVYSANLAELCKEREVRAMDNNGSKISHDFWSLSRLRGCNPSELESLRPLGPGSAEIKLHAQSWGKGGQGPNGGWGTGQWLQ